MFTADFLPPHPRRFPLRMDLGRIQRAMEKVAAHDGIMVVHAEDHDIVQFNYERFKAEGRAEGWKMNNSWSTANFPRACHSDARSDWLPLLAPASTSFTPPPAMVSKP